MAKFKFRNSNFLDSIGIKFESDHCVIFFSGTESVLLMRCGPRISRMYNLCLVITCTASTVKLLFTSVKKE